MKIPALIFTLLPLLFTGCKGRTADHSRLMMSMEKDLEAGNLRRVRMVADSLISACPEERYLVQRADSLSQIADRIALDFSVTEEEVGQQIRERTGDFTSGEKAAWEKCNWLEYRIINGEKRYFNRAATNLRLLKNFYLFRAESDSADSRSPEMVSRKEHISSVIKLSEKRTATVAPVEMVIDYKLTVFADAVPAGEIVRCWLPYPGDNHVRQDNIKLLSASGADYIISPDTSVHRTIYMEARAEKGVPLVFSVSYSYRSSGQYFDPSNLKMIEYDKSSETYRKYTAQQLPHIRFSEDVRHLADSITAGEEDPYEIVRKIYYWFYDNIPWAGAQEYSIIQDIPGYVVRNRRGDCGMQTFLLMSMLRYKGIPVRWQSGWKVPPGARNLHDWCEVYYEGHGWVPVDISYGLQYSDETKNREFYISGIDSYRLIINDGVAGALYPPKKYLRSEPFDFQRGEVEWSGGNLYFDKWDYDMQISYSK